VSEPKKKEEPETLCPMTYNVAGSTDMTCGEERCAWWRPTEKCCAIVLLPNVAEAIMYGATQLRSARPAAGDFGITYVTEYPDDSTS
jgi:hypothetical protein